MESLRPEEDLAYRVSELEAEARRAAEQRDATVGELNKRVRELRAAVDANRWWLAAISLFLAVPYLLVALSLVVWVVLRG